MNHVVRGKFHYHDKMQRRGVCRCDIVEDGDKTYVVFTELNENKGPSVTNAIEDIVNIFFENRKYADLDTFVIVERYEYKPMDLDLVTLSRKERRKFSEPKWSRMTGEVAEKLGVILAKKDKT